MRIDRRKALALLGLGAAAPAAAQGSAVSFRHGVASGDPTQGRVVLWTRLTPAKPGNVAYTWELLPVDRRAGGVKRGKGVTGPDRDYTIKVDATGLDAGRAYTFRFEAAGAVSPTGRTRTLPKGATTDVVMAVASCSLYPNGYFHAYQAIADLERVDVVLHLGDYIYEYGGPDTYGMTSAVAGERPHDPPHEIVSLADYRGRHAQYKSDPGLQAAHARAPWIVSWDDHETTNDSFATGAENHSPESEGDWNARKAVALKAYYEWMPIREPAAGAGLAEDGKADVAAFNVKLNDPRRRMMSPKQEAWVGAEAARSVKAGHAWQVLGNQVVMARVRPFSPKAMLTPEQYAAIPEANRRRVQTAEETAALGVPSALDMWEGYPADRERLYGVLRGAGARPIVLAGDSHSFWANELHDAKGALVACEFGTTGITSPGAGEIVPGLNYGEPVARANPEVIFNDQVSQGFMLLTLTRGEARADMVAVSTIVAKAFTTRTVKSYRTAPEGKGVSKLAEI